MRVYIAGAYGRYAELRERALQLQEMGHIVTADWLLYPRNNDDDGVNFAMSGVDLAAEADRDVGNIYDSNTFILTAEPEGVFARGSKHVEFGIAIAQQLRLIVIGRRETLFTHLPEVEFYETWDQFLEQEAASVPRVCSIDGDCQPGAAVLSVTR